MQRGPVRPRIVKRQEQRADIRAEDVLLLKNKRKIPEKIPARIRRSPSPASVFADPYEDGYPVRGVRKHEKSVPRRPVRPPTPPKKSTSHDWSIIGTLTSFSFLFLIGLLFGRGGFFQFLFFSSSVCTCIYSAWLCLRCFFIDEIGWGIIMALIWGIAFILVLFSSFPLIMLFFLSLCGSLLYGWFHSTPAKKAEGYKPIRKNER